MYECNVPIQSKSAITSKLLQFIPAQGPRWTPMDSLKSQCPIDCRATDAHVHVGSILPSQGLCLDPLVYLALLTFGVTVLWPCCDRGDGDSTPWNKWLYTGGHLLSVGMSCFLLRWHTGRWLHTLVWDRLRAVPYHYKPFGQIQCSQVESQAQIRSSCWVVEAEAGCDWPVTKTRRFGCVSNSASVTIYSAPKTTWHRKVIEAHHVPWEPKICTGQHGVCICLDSRDF